MYIQYIHILHVHTVHLEMARKRLCRKRQQIQPRNKQKQVFQSILKGDGMLKTPQIFFALNHSMMTTIHNKYRRTCKIF